MTSITLRRSATDLAVKLKFASGLPGVPGEASDLQEGSVTTLDASADADFSITGTPPNQILNLSLPRGLTGPVGEGSGGLFFTTRSAAASATIASDIKVIRTAGYSAVGDRGHGLHKRVSALPSHSGYFRSVDRYMPDGTTDGTNGGYWELVPDMSGICIEQFGGKADYVPPSNDWANTGHGTGTDNFAAWTAMMTMTDRQASATQQFCPQHSYRAGAYYFSQTLIHTKIVDIIGRGSGRDMIGSGEGTIFVFPADTTHMVFHSTTSGPGETQARSPGPNGGTAGGSRISGFSTWSEGAWPNTDRTKHGLRLRARVVARDIGIYKCGGDGVHMWCQGGSGGATEGLANDSHLENIQVYISGRNGFYIRGNDSNACHFIGLETKSQGGENGCGLYEESGLGNVYMGVNFAGYGNEGVHRAGRLYILIASGVDEAISNIGGVTTPGTNDKIWLDIGAGSPSASYPEWSGSNQHNLQLPVFVGGLGNRTVLSYIYVEGSMPCHISPPAIAVQGQCGFTRYSSSVQAQPGQGPFSPLGVGGQQTSQAGQSRYTYNGGNSYVYVGASASADVDKGICILAHNRDREGGNPYEWRYLDDRMTYGRASAKPIWEITTTATAVLPGRPTGETLPYMPMFHDLLLRNPSDSSGNITLGLRNSIPASDAYGQRVGDVYFNDNPTAGGFVGWVRTTTGWKTFGAISA